MALIPLDQVRAVTHRLFIDAPEATLRKEDAQKSRQLVGVLSRLARLRRGAHLVDAAAGKSSVGLVAAALLPIGRLTVIERDPARVAACRAAAGRLERAIEVDVRQGDVADPSSWPSSPDAVVALHACGGAADLVIVRAIAAGARQLFVAPCCYGQTVPFRADATALVAKLDLVTDEPIRRRLAASFIDIERKLTLEAAGYQTDIEEFVGPTATPHNLLFCARRTASDVRVRRAEERLTKLLALGEQLGSIPPAHRRPTEDGDDVRS